MTCHAHVRPRVRPRTHPCVLLLSLPPSLPPFLLSPLSSSLSLSLLSLSPSSLSLSSLSLTLASQHLAYKATEGKSHFGMTRAVEKLGGHVACGARCLYCLWGWVGVEVEVGGGGGEHALRGANDFMIHVPCAYMFDTLTGFLMDMVGGIYTHTQPRLHHVCG